MQLESIFKTSGIKLKSLEDKQVKNQNRPNVYGVRQECGSIHRGDTRSALFLVQ